MNEERDIENMMQPLRRFSLTDAEHEAMRSELKLFIAKHPARMPIYAGMLEYFRTTVAAIHGVTSTRYTSAAMAFALVLCVGVGTSYAAESSLPGDPLYSVKVSLNEGVREALAVTPKAKAEWSTTVASRRLEEAELLAANGTLTLAASAEIKQSLEESAKKFDDSVAALAVGADASAEIADVQSTFEAELNAHAQVLAALSEAVPAASERIAPILASVQIRASGAAASREIAERTIARSDSTRIKNAADAKKTVAKKQVKDIRALAARGTAESAAMADTNAVEAEIAIEQGDQRLRDGDYGVAFGAFQAAIRAAHETRVNVDASERLRGKVNLSLTSNVSSGAGNPAAATLMMMSATTSATSTATTSDGEAIQNAKMFPADND